MSDGVGSNFKIEDFECVYRLSIVVHAACVLCDSSLILYYHNNFLRLSSSSSLMPCLLLHRLFKFLFLKWIVVVRCSQGFQAHFVNNVRSILYKILAYRFRKDILDQFLMDNEAVEYCRSGK